jgi:two-component system response regulator HydG
MAHTRLIGASAAIKQIEEDARWAARSDAKVLLTGESGVGKEVVAQLIHEQSMRSRHPLVTINCAGIPETLLASELFGHARGSFTGAHRDKPGRLEQAHAGTVFMDEVGEMSLQMQAMLLRFLENGEIQRVGSEHRPTRVNVRVITATNRVLLDRVATKDFREDLYYRLNVIHIEIPPLRARRDDVPVLVDHFVRHFAAIHGVPAPRITEAAQARLLAYDWPGNVRELKNIAERLVVRWRSGEIAPADLPAEFHPQRPRAAAVDEAPVTQSIAESLFDRMTQGQESFWSAVHTPFMARDITREDLRGLVRGGMIATRGNYRAMVQLFNMPVTDYKRFLTFLRKHQAHLPVHEFRVPSTVRSIARPLPAYVRESEFMAMR